jgi:hypothetical protein
VTIAAVRVYFGNTTLPALAKHISSVIPCRPSPKVVWVDAQRVIARMTNKQAFWYFAFMKGE